MQSDHDAQGLFVTEDECARRLGIGPDKWRVAREQLKRHGLPPADDVMGRRYWPAVKNFFDRKFGLDHTVPVENVTDGDFS